MISFVEKSSIHASTPPALLIFIHFYFMRHFVLSTYSRRAFALSSYSGQSEIQPQLERASLPLHVIQLNEPEREKK